MLPGVLPITRKQKSKETKLTCTVQGMQNLNEYFCGVVSKRKFYRIELVVDGKLIAEFFGKDKDSMNENYLKLKKHCEG